MRVWLKRILTAGIGIPAIILKRMRGYESLAAVRLQPRPRILLVACHWLGDTFWAAQVVPVLKSVWPDCELCCVTKSVCAPIWSGGLAVTEWIDGGAVVSDRRRETVDWFALHRLGCTLRKRSWDLVIDLTGNRYSAILTHWIHAKHTLGFDGGEFGSLYATCVQDAERNRRHLSERPFRIIEPLLEDFVYSRELKAPQPVHGYAEKCFEYGLSPNDPLAVIAPTAGWSAKEWGDDNFSKLAGRLLQKKYSVALLDSPAGKNRLESIAQAASQDGRNAVVVTESGIESAMALITGCALFVGNDSGLGHIAAAMGRTAVSIFTEETNSKICGPIGPAAYVVHAGDFEETFVAIMGCLDQSSDETDKGE